MMKEFIISDNHNVLNDYSANFEERAKMLNHTREMEEKTKIEADKSHFSNFAQINRDNISHIIKACADNSQAVRILLFILEHMDKYNALVCSYKVFQEHLGISQPTIARAIKYLKDNGFIVILKSGTSNVYVMNDQLAWTNKGSKVTYCQFPANVILSAAEQEEVNKIKNIKFQNIKQLKERKNNT